MRGALLPLLAVPVFRDARGGYFSLRRAPPDGGSGYRRKGPNGGAYSQVVNIRRHRGGVGAGGHLGRHQRGQPQTHRGRDGWAGAVPVSYTHLRAHETRHDLVCRLLLEKKKRQNKEKYQTKKIKKPKEKKHKKKKQK